MSKTNILRSSFKRHSLLLCFLVSFYSLVAQDGTFDSSFNGTGILQTPDNYANQIKLQSDGKIILAGNSKLTRYNTDGTPDVSFGINGIDSITFGDAKISIFSIAIQPDNKIVVLGQYPYGQLSDKTYIIFRRLANGKPDNSLNGTGFAQLSLINDSVSIFQIGLQLDNKILLAGTKQIQGAGFVIGRLNTDGTGDATFGTGGIVHTSFGVYSYGDPFGSYAKSIAVQNDGKIIAVGTSATLLSNGFTADSLAIARYNPDGSLDKSFNGTGKLTYSPDNPSWAGAEGSSVVIQPDGQIVVAGILGYNQSHGRWFVSTATVWRFNPDGSPDTSFNKIGLKPISQWPPVGTGNHAVVDVSLQCDGKIVTGINAGSVDFEMEVHGLLSRFNQDGSIDSTFGRAGIAEFYVNDSNIYHKKTMASSMALSYNRIYMVGVGINGGPQDIFAFKQGAGIDSSNLHATNTCYHDSTIFSLTVADTDSVKWDFGDGYAVTIFSSTTFTTKHLYANKGTYRVSCSVYTKCGINQVHKNILIAGAGDLQLGSDTTLCEGLQVTLHSNIEGQSYQWNTGDIAGNIVVSHTGSYSLEVINDGCRMIDTILVTFNKRPGVHLGNDTTLCSGSAIKLVVDPPFTTILWEDNSMFPERIISSGGLYIVKVELNGCTIADTISIVQKAPPHFSLGPDTTVCNGETITLHPVVFADSFLWEDGSILASRKIIAPGIYRLKASNTCGDFSDEIRIDYHVCEILMPSAFTPNQDGLNDEFRWKYSEPAKNFMMQIYNRSGQVVFTTKDVFKGWNGTTNGVKQSPGNYVWTIQYENANGESKNLKGTVLLIR